MVAYCKTVVDGPRGVRGLAYILEAYSARLHHHPVAERYTILAGTARLRVGELELLVGRGFSIWIPPGVPHNLKPVTESVLMEYLFPRGPLESIPYTWLPSRL